MYRMLMGVVATICVLGCGGMDDGTHLSGTVKLVSSDAKIAQPQKDTPEATGVSQGEKPLLERYQSDLEIPDDLYETYEELTLAFKAGDRESIERLCLPFSVEIATGSRPQESMYLGRSLNLPFARQHFLPEILLARQEDENTIMLRTGTSALWFVQTNRGVWRLYAYIDKPIA